MSVVALCEMLLGGAAVRDAPGSSDGAVTPWKPASDTRSYRALELSNGLRVMLIHDAEAPVAAACMTVGVGHTEDPVLESPTSTPRVIAGAAHAVEHLLFLGTDKYPAVDAYKSFLKDHGGASNAATGAYSTNYYFTVHAEHLASALDIFSQFFLAPRFDPDYVNREMNAVHAEDAKNRQDDGRRALQVFKDVVARSHPYSKFGTGNLSTLTGPELDTRALLLQHYKDTYSAGKMQLCVLGREPLDTLEAWVRGRGAHATALDTVPALSASGASSSVKTTEKVPPHPLVASQLGRTIHIIPRSERRSLKLQWPMPWGEELPGPGPAGAGGRASVLPDDSSPQGLLAHLLGHEGTGTPLWYLKEVRGWATGLSASGSAYKDWGVFEVSVQLTEAGLEAADEVAAVIFEYVELLRGLRAGDLTEPAPGAPLPSTSWPEGGPTWGGYYAETRAMQLARLRFRPASEPVNAVKTYSGLLGLYDPLYTIIAGDVRKGVDGARLRQLLDLLVPQNALMTLVAKAAGQTDATPDEEALESVSGRLKARGCAPVMHRERYYGVSYLSTPFTPAQLTAWGGDAAVPAAEGLLASAGWYVSSAGSKCGRLTPRAGLALPPPNPHIPTDFTLRDAAGSIVAPRKPDATPTTAEATPLRTLQPHAWDLPTAAVPLPSPCETDAAVAASSTPATPSPSAAPLTYTPFFAAPKALAFPASDALTLPVRAWHLNAAATFRIPRAHAAFWLHMPPSFAASAVEDPKPAVTTRLFLMLARTLLAGPLYDADCAGADWSVSASTLQRSVSFEVSGYSHKLPTLLDAVLDALLVRIPAGEPLAVPSSASSPSSSPAPAPHDVYAVAFAAQKDVYCRSLLSLRKQQAHAYANDVLDYLLCGPSLHTAEDRLAALEGIQLEDVLAWGKTWLSGGAPTHVEALLYGNLTEDEGRTYCSAVTQRLAGSSPGSASTSCSPSPSSRKGRRDVVLPAGGHPLFATRVHPNPEETNAAVQAVWQLGPGTPRNRALGRLLRQLLAIPVFTQLRTREQLGYIVHTVVRGGDLGPSSMVDICVVVVSATSTPAELQARVLGYVEGGEWRSAHFEGLTEAELQKTIAILADNMLQPERRLGSVYGRLSSVVARGSEGGWVSEEEEEEEGYSWHGIEEEAAALRALTLADVRSVLDACFGVTAPARRLACVRVVPPGRKGDDGSPLPPPMPPAEPGEVAEAEARAWKAAIKPHPQPLGAAVPVYLP